MDDFRLITEELIDGLIRKSAESPRKRVSFNLHRSFDDLVQRVINALQPGTYVRPHRHITMQKTESFVALRGSVGAILFDDAGNIVSSHRLEVGKGTAGIDFEPNQWHTLVALEPGTVCFEVKTGPYRVNTDKDFALWAPEEGSPECDEIVNKWTALFERK